MTIRKYFFVIISVILTGISQSAWTQAPSAYDFMKPAKNSKLVVSPNGQYIAYVTAKTGKYCLDRFKVKIAKYQGCNEKHKELRTINSIVFHDLDSQTDIKTENMPENIDVNWLEFANDQRLLAGIGTANTIGRMGRARIVLKQRIVSIPVASVDEDSSQPVLLFNEMRGWPGTSQYLSLITHPLRSDPEHIIMSGSTLGPIDLWKVNVFTGEAVALEKGNRDTIYWQTDRFGSPKFRFDCSGKTCSSIKVYGKKSGSEKWELIQKFVNQVDRGNGEFQFFPIGTTDEEDLFYVITDNPEDGRRAVKLYDLGANEIVRTVYEHPKFDVGGALWDHQTDGFMGVWFYENSLKYDLQNSKFQQYYDGLISLFPKDSAIKILGHNADGSSGVVLVSSPDSPGSYYRYDAKLGVVKRLLDREPELGRQMNSTGQTIDVVVRDGTTISAFNYAPKNNASAPLIVMPHGGPHIRDNFAFDHSIQYFVSLGYQVVTMNFRGSYGYGRAFEESGYGEWGGLMQDDITDVVKYFHANGLATPDKTCIVGYSYGGYAALYGSAMTPELYSCAVSGGGVADLSRQLADDRVKFDDELYDFLEKSIGGPEPDKNSIDAKSPVNLADRIKAPVLIIHGEYDERVGIVQGKRMEKALKKTNSPVEFVKLVDSGHDGWTLDTEVFYLETVADFLNQHIGGEL